MEGSSPRRPHRRRGRDREGEFAMPRRSRRSLFLLLLAAPRAGMGNERPGGGPGSSHTCPDGPRRDILGPGSRTRGEASRFPAPRRIWRDRRDHERVRHLPPSFLPLSLRLSNLPAEIFFREILRDPFLAAARRGSVDLEGTLRFQESGNSRALLALPASPSAIPKTAFSSKSLGRNPASPRPRPARRPERSRPLLPKHFLGAH